MSTSKKPVRNSATSNESTAEKAMKLGRNFNAIVTLAGIAALPFVPVAVQPALAIYNTWNAAQTVGFEAGRQFAKSKRTKKLGKLAVAH